MSEVLKRFEPLFYPRSVAVIGASNDPAKWGFRLLHPLIHCGYEGKIYPINRREKEILGLKGYPSVRDVPEDVDLSIIAIPPEGVIEAVRDCQAKEVGAMVIITAGFSEVGEKERRLEEALIEQINKDPVPVIGPNCMGIMCNDHKFHGHTIFFQPPPGPISIVSQSGNIGGSIMAYGVMNQIGFEKFVSSGNEATTFVEDIIEYYGEDPKTKAIVSYIEGIDHGQKFIDVARKVAPNKPVVVLKGGITEAGAKAGKSHSGAMAGEEAIFDSACRQSGIIRVDDLSDLFWVAAAIIGYPLPRGGRVGIITGGGGWGVLTADACHRYGLDVVPLPRPVYEELDKIMPSRWSHGNPVDLAAAPDQDLYPRSAEALMKSSEIDCVILTGLGFGGRIEQVLKMATGKLPEKLASDKSLERWVRRDRRMVELIMELIDNYKKPILCCTDAIVGSSVAGNPTLEALAQKGQAVYPSPGVAAKVLSKMVKYANYLRSIEG